MLLISTFYSFADLS